MIATDLCVGVFTKLMVVGGYPSSSSYYTTEVIDLSGQGQSCVLKDSPINVEAVGVFINGQAMVCASSNHPDKCYVYDNQVGNYDKNFVIFASNGSVRSK